MPAALIEASGAVGLTDGAGHGPSALVLGGRGPHALRATLETLSSSPQRTWCAVETTEEAGVAYGLAQVRHVVPWDGVRAALAQLYQQAGDAVLDGPVVIVAAGTVLSRRYLSDATRLLAGGTGLVVPGRSVLGGLMAADRAGLGRLAPRLLPRTVLRPGSGLVVDGHGLSNLAERGWLAGEELTIREVARLAGRVRVRPKAITTYRPEPGHQPVPERRMTVTVMIPAHNEEAWIGETLRSLRRQSLPPDEVIVVDDCSSDRTGEVARHLGAKVLRTASPRLKAGAQRFGLDHVWTEAVVMIDADTTLHPDAVHLLVADLENGKHATNGAVLPQVERGIWARGRVIEYAMAQRLLKRAQTALSGMIVLSGCVAAFRTEVLREVDAFEHPTITEDIELTWRLALEGYDIGYVPNAWSYPAEPTSWALYRSQMRRWAAGFCECISLYGKSLKRRPGLLLVILAAFWDLLTACLLMVVTVASLATGNQDVTPWSVALAGLWVAVPLVVGSTLVGLRRTVLALPAYLVVMLTAQYFYLEAMMRHWVFRRRITTWVKGH
jgi:biofilm PGA synthesis N-glycosyltransferase PgaC